MQEKVFCCVLWLLLLLLLCLSTPPTPNPFLKEGEQFSRH